MLLASPVRMFQLLTFGKQPPNCDGLFFMTRRLPGFYARLAPPQRSDDPPKVSLYPLTFLLASY